MRQSVGSLADFANVTWPANANATLSITLQFLCSSVGGIPTNLLVLYISFFSKGLGEYKYFLANLAICDLLSCLSDLFQFCSHLYHLLGNVPLNVHTCQIQSLPPYVFGFCMGATLPLASLNRYCVICLDKEEWFTSKRIALLCAITYFPMLSFLIDALFADQVVAYCDLCSYTRFTPFNPEWVLVILTIYVYPTLIFCNVSVYKKISTHLKATKRLVNTSLMQNERSILKALIFQAAIPLILSTPIFMVFAMLAFTSFDTNTLLRKVIIRFGDYGLLTTFDFCSISFTFNEMFDAIVTLIVVRPYRTAAKEILFNVKRKFVGHHSTTVL